MKVKELIFFYCIQSDKKEKKNIFDDIEILWGEKGKQYVIYKKEKKNSMW